MTIIHAMQLEFEREAQTTRKHLARLPDKKFDWRPHKKSFTAGALVSHIIDSIRWGDLIFNRDELDFDPSTYKPYVATSLADLLTTFDEEVANCQRVLTGVTDADLWQLWRLKVSGQMLLEKPRADVFRDFILSHMIHHRGQLSVYLRLLDIPVPGSYGPTADEQI